MGVPGYLLNGTKTPLKGIKLQQSGLSTSTAATVAQWHGTHFVPWKGIVYRNDASRIGELERESEKKGNWEKNQVASLQIT